MTRFGWLYSHKNHLYDLPLQIVVLLIVAYSSDSTSSWLIVVDFPLIICIRKLWMNLYSLLTGKLRSINMQKADFMVISFYWSSVKIKQTNKQKTTAISLFRTEKQCAMPNILLWWESLHNETQNVYLSARGRNTYFQINQFPL